MSIWLLAIAVIGLLAAAAVFVALRATARETTGKREAGEDSPQPRPDERRVSTHARGTFVGSDD